jgi:hypothetical protein
MAFCKHPRGVEQTANSSGNPQDLIQGGAKSGAVDGFGENCDANLQTVIGAWSLLSATTKAAFVAIVNSELRDVER